MREHDLELLQRRKPRGRADDRQPADRRRPRAKNRRSAQNDLASTVIARLNSAPGGCKQALKNQLSQVDTQELTVEKVQPHGSTSATAEVKSTYAGKNKLTTVTLVKEDGAWKISKLG